MSCRGSSAVSSPDHRKWWSDAVVHGVLPRRRRSVCRPSKTNGGPRILSISAWADVAASQNCHSAECCRGSLRDGIGEFPTEARLSSARSCDTGERGGTELWPLPFGRGAMPSSADRLWRNFATASGGRELKRARIAPTARLEYSVSSNLSVLVPHRMQRTNPLKYLYLRRGVPATIA